MKEIIELNRRLNATFGFAQPGRELHLTRQDAPGESAAIPLSWRMEIESLREQISQCVPDDFEFWLLLRVEEPCFEIEYNDGPQATYCKRHDWNPAISIIEQLQGFDWDEERRAALELCRFMDEFRELAPQLPSQLPPTKAVQREFADEMREFVRAKRKDAGGVHILKWREDDGLTEQDFPTMEELKRELPTIMMLQHLVITVVVGGKPLPVRRIEELKRAALADLDGCPISLAKAQFKVPSTEIRIG